MDHDDGLKPEYEEEEEVEYVEEEEEFEEEDEEPQLKYHRVGQDVSELFQKEVASCLTVHSRFLVCFVPYSFFEATF